MFGLFGIALSVWAWHKTMTDSIGKISQHDNKSQDNIQVYVRACHPCQWPLDKLSFQAFSPEEEQTAAWRSVSITGNVEFS